MKPNAFLAAALGLSISLTLSGCKIVKDLPEDETAIAADASGDDARTELRMSDTFEAQLLPYVRDTAQPIAELRAALALGLDAAGEAGGHRGAGAGAAWNFAVSGQGTVTEVKLDTKARWADLDTTGDGAGDLRLQLGPVIKGSALRDIAPFYNFDDFRDQIEFAKLGRAINDAISARIILPEGDLTGRTLEFTGVVPLKSASDRMMLTPTDLKVME